jgi:hypothetical protein
VASGVMPWGEFVEDDEENNVAEKLKVYEGSRRLFLRSARVAFSLALR